MSGSPMSQSMTSGRSIHRFFQVPHFPEYAQSTVYPLRSQKPGAEVGEIAVIVDQKDSERRLAGRIAVTRRGRLAGATMCGVIEG